MAWQTRADGALGMDLSIFCLVASWPLAAQQAAALRRGSHVNSVLIHSLLVLAST